MPNARGNRLLDVQARATSIVGGVQAEKAPGFLFRHLLLLCVAYAALLLLFTAAFERTSAHSDSRLATIWSLVERGTFAIDGSPYDTIDKVMIDGRYYSHQPPLQALAGALVYFPLRQLGWQLAPGKHVAFVLVTFALNGLTALITVVFFFRALPRTGLDRRWHLPLAVSLACGTLLLPFGTTLNGHGFVAALMMIALYYFVLSQEPGAKSRDVFWSGAAFSLCSAADHTMLAFYAVFAGCLLLRSRRLSQLMWFALPSVLILLPTVAYYYSIGHSIVPFATRPELFSFPGSPWSATGSPQNRLTGASWNSWSFASVYGFLMLVGPHGFLIYNPTAWLALYGLALTIWTKGAYWQEAAAAAAGSAAVIAYYALVSVNYSGFSYSIRWFVPLLPLWWFFGAAALGRLMTRRRRLVLGLAALSVCYAVAGALNPWPPPSKGYLTPLSNVWRVVYWHA